MSNISISPEQWSLLVKERDLGTCTKCGSQNEVQAVLVKPGDSFTMDNGLTLCVGCANNGVARPELSAQRLKRTTTRMNLDLDSWLYEQFRAVCKQRKQTISRVVRSLVEQYVANAPERRSDDV